MNHFVIDIRTLLLVGSIIFFCRAALLAYAWVINRTYRPIRYWAIGSSLAAFGVLLLSLRGIVPLPVSVMLGQGALIVGWMFTSAGTITATERTPPWRWGYGTAIAALAGAFCLLIVWPDDAMRTIVVSLPGLVFDAYSAYVCFRFTGGRWRTITFRILASTLSVSIVSGVLKNLYVLRSGSGHMFDANAQSSQYFVLSVITLITCTVLYVLLIELKSREELAQEVEQRKRAEERIKDLVYYDSLTQLPNRRMLTERLDLAGVTSKRTGLHGALMLLDLDNFKQLNDKHGHAVGDLLLIEVAQRLRASVREIDAVARLGGDEFIVLLTGLDVDKGAAQAQVQAVAEKLRAKLAAPYFMTLTHEAGADQSIEHHCSASIGVTLFCGEVSHQNEIIRQADEAMYRAKAAGRNSICFFDTPQRMAA
jgi:diguanylate cyclase (GGDEF)-like protein